MKPEDLQDINKLPRLKYLNLAFNDLTWLPDPFFELKNLEHLDLRYNKFPEDIQEQINKAFPNTKIIWRS